MCVYVCVCVCVCVCVRVCVRVRMSNRQTDRQTDRDMQLPIQKSSCIDHLISFTDRIALYVITLHYHRRTRLKLLTDSKFNA